MIHIKTAGLTRAFPVESGWLFYIVEGYRHLAYDGQITNINFEKFSSYAWSDKKRPLIEKGNRYKVIVSLDLPGRWLHLLPKDVQKYLTDTPADERSKSVIMVDSETQHYIIMRLPVTHGLKFYIQSHPSHNELSFLVCGYNEGVLIDNPFYG